MPQDMKIDYLELPASDLAAVQAFSGSVFNWSFESYGPTYLAFNDGRLDGGFYVPDSSIRSDADAGAALIVFYAKDLIALAARIEAAGGKIVKPIFDFPGGQRFQFTDPHGNELAVWSDQITSDS